MATLGEIKPSVFRSHRWGADFSYSVGEFAPNQPLLITLGFAEIYEPNCNPKKRLMDVLVNGVKEISQLDVYSQAGACNTPYLVNVEATATADGNLEIQFVRKRQKAMVSYIKVSTDVTTP